MPDTQRARYHQPRWMNAVVIVWCSLCIAGWIVLPKPDGPILVLVGFSAMTMFVAIVNKIRAGAFAPRWDELRQIKAAQPSSRFDQLLFASLVMVAAPFIAGLLAFSLGNSLDRTSPSVAGILGLVGFVCGVAFAVVNFVRVLRRPA